MSVVASAADYTGTEVIDGVIGIDTLRFASITASETLVLNGLLANVDQVAIATAAGVATGTVALNVDASAVGYGLLLEGNGGMNAIAGTAFADSIVVAQARSSLHGGGGR